MIKFIIKLLVLLTALHPLTSGAVTLTRQIAIDNDDAEERQSNGSVNRGDNDLELGYDGNLQQIVGLRFQNLTIPGGATITNAFIQFTVEGTDSNATNLVLSGDDADNSGAIANVNFDISGRTRTTASVNWNNVPAWNSVGAAGVDQRTPDLTSIVQEIIARPGWSSGNAMTIIIDAGAGCNSSSCRRQAESRDGSAGDAAELVIEYTTLVPGTADLALSKSDSADPADNNSIITYTLDISNAGPEAANNVLVSDPLPAGMTFVSANATQGSCTFAAGTVDCNLGTLLATDSAVVYIVARVPATSGTLSNTASVSSDEPDANMSNNSATETTDVTPLNSDQLCYLVADAGGGNGGNDLLTTSDSADTSNEMSIGTGTGTFNIEAIAWRADTGVLYGADAGQLGIISTTTGVFTARPQSFGTGSGAAGNITFSDVDGLAWDGTTGMLFGSHTRAGSDLLFVIDPVTGAHVPDAFGAGIDYVVIQQVSGNDITDDITVDITTGTMYASVNSGGVTDRLIIIDKTTGATTDIAAMTVPDIEGLGTDEFGQLWGVSGTQNRLYEIDKNTGIGSNGRPLSQGTDYESVDCYSTSPTLVADIAMLKTVSDAMPPPGGNIDYTITATNNGTGNATILQVQDSLPGGVTFVSATPSTGTYDAATGVWYIGNLNDGASATLILNVNVDSGTGNSTITNTASVLSLSQSDPVSGNDTASVDITPAGPMIVSTKSTITLSDPFSGVSNPKAIPGAVIEYRITVQNTGSGGTDPDSVIIGDVIPANNALLVTDFDGTNPGPVAFIDGTPASGLSYNFIALGDVTDSISFSNDNGASYTYVPADSGDGTDPAVTDIRIQFTGALLGDTGAGRTFDIRFKTVLQ
ncbi:MAG: DUF11 domain-containing protein [Gammaproteobacteria bacterium]|nr:DUF11 domain-containing protein [Gammaproteobacteria bacterium]